MRVLIARLKPLYTYVRVNLCRSEARVAEEFLNCAQVGAPIKQVGRRAVSERVRACRASRSHSEQISDNRIYLAYANSRAFGIQKQVTARLFVQQLWSAHRHPLF